MVILTSDKIYFNGMTLYTDKRVNHQEVTKILSMHQVKEAQTTGSEFQQNQRGK